MSEDKEIQKAVGLYLEKVAAQLTDVPPDEKDTILQSVESHIYEALERRSPGAPTLADLAFVFAEMSPPSSYAQGRKETMPPPAPAPAPAPVPPARVPAPPREPRLCWYPVVGLILTPFAIAIAAMVISIAIAMIVPTLGTHVWLWTGATPYRNTQFGLGFGALPFFVAMGTMALALPVISTTLGFVGILKIRASRRALYGMPLAVAVSLVFPLAVSDVLAVFVAVLSVRSLHVLGDALGGIAKLIFLLELALIVWANVAASRRVWRWANRPAGQGQPA